MNCVDYIVELFETRGDAEYLGEPVSQKNMRYNAPRWRGKMARRTP